jgi:hypothetical protein
MQIGDLVKRNPDTYNICTLTPRELEEMGVVIGFDHGPRAMLAIVHWSMIGRSWEQREDLEVLNESR